MERQGKTRGTAWLLQERTKLLRFVVGLFPRVALSHMVVNKSVQ